MVLPSSIRLAFSARCSGCISVRATTYITMSLMLILSMPKGSPLALNIARAFFTSVAS